MLLSVTAVFGRLHPVLVHLPIGILLIGLLLQWLHNKEKHAISLPVIRIVFMTGMAFAWISCATGYVLSTSGDYDDDGLVTWHMWMGIAVAATASLICWKIVKQQTDLWYKLLSAGLLILITITGHLGGSLTHGSDYLTAAFKVDNTPYPVHPPIVNVQEAKLYADVIQPIFQKECYNCHGRGRQKGKLRMDDSAWIAKGGKSGPLLIPSKPDGSELMKRILLPTDDEHHMPKEKPSLKESEISLIKWWIAEGADFSKKVKDFKQTARIHSYLLALQSDNMKQADSLVPSSPVEEADGKSIEALKAKGVAILPVAQKSNYLMADFINSVNIRDQDLALLVPLKKQLIWLKLGNTKIGDSAMTYIGQCRMLTQLQLNHTLVTDKGLAAIKSLKGLRRLNLVGTAVTARGIQSINSLKQLKYLYLYQTGVGEKDWAVLIHDFPKTHVDSGGFTLPFLASDTVVLKEPRKE